MKKLIAMAIVLCMVLGMMPMIAVAADTDTTLYLAPGADWPNDNAWFAVYYWNSETNVSAWTQMEYSEEAGLYTAVVPAGNNKVIFCRMDPSKTALDWASKWNQSVDLDLPTDGTNCWSVENPWNESYEWKATGTWSTYTPAGSGDELPSGSVTIESYGNVDWTAPASGTVQFTINPLTESIEVVEGWSPIAQIAGSGTVAVTEGTTYLLATQATADITVDWAYISLGESEGGSTVVGTPIDFVFGGINNNSGMGGTWTHTATEDGTLVLSNINFFNMSMEQPNVYIVDGTGEPVVLGSEDVYFHVANGETVAVYIPNGCYGQLNVAWETGFVTAPVIKDGQYAISVVVDGVHKVATAQSGDNFGYLYDPQDGTMENDILTVADDSLVYWTFTRVEGDTYTIQDSEGRYVYQTGGYNNFNFAAEVPAEGHTWLVFDNGDGTYTIKNVLKDKTVAYGVGYSSYGSYADVGDNIAALYLTPAGNVQTPPPVGSYGNPIEIESLPYSDTYTANQDLYYTWTADKTGTLVITVPSTAYLSNMAWDDTTDDGSVVTYICPVTEGETYSMNPWGGELDGTFTVAWKADDSGDEGGEGEGNEGEGGEGGEGEEIVSAPASGTDVAVNSDYPNYETLTYVYEATEDGVLTLVISGNPGWFYTQYVGSIDNPVTNRITGSEETTATFDVVAGNTYIFVLGVYNKTAWCEADGTLTYNFSFEAKEIDSTTDKEEWAVSDTVITAPGEYTIDVLENANMTVVEFTPDKTAYYTISVNGGTVAYVGGGTHFIYAQDSVTWASSFEWLCEQVEEEETLEIQDEDFNWITITQTNPGQSCMIGIVSEGESVELTITKGEDYTPKAELEPVVYENENLNGKFEIPENAVIGDYVDVYGETVHTAVKGEDGYYHLDSADGPILLVDLDYMVTLSDALTGGRGVMYACVYDENGEMIEKWDIGAAIREYEGMADENGYYPLTDDLIFFYQVYGGNQGFYDPEKTTVFVEQTTTGEEGNIDTTTEVMDFNEDCAWMFACITMSVVEEEEPEETTTAPEETTTAPEETTTAPEETTEATEPETTEGEETTEATEPETTEGEETTEATEPETTEPEATEPEETTEPEEVTEITVKVTVPEGWENPAIWAWTDSQNAFDAWPGLALTKGEDGYWYATVPAWVENIIINANGGNVKTADLKLAQTKVDVDVVVSLAADGKVNAELTYSSPDTGDGTALTAMALAMVLAAAGFVTTVGSKKKFF